MDPKLDADLLLLLGEIKGELGAVRAQISDGNDATNRRIEDLREAIDRRFDDQQRSNDQRFDSVEERVGGLEKSKKEAGKKNVAVGAGSAGLAVTLAEVVKAFLNT